MHPYCTRNLCRNAVYVMHEYTHKGRNVYKGEMLGEWTCVLTNSDEMKWLLSNRSSLNTVRSLPEDKNTQGNTTGGVLQIYLIYYLQLGLISAAHSHPVFVPPWGRSAGLFQVYKEKYNIDTNFLQYCELISAIPGQL